MCIRDRSDADTGAGDQGMMFGYACTDTDELMPAPIYYAHKLCRQLSAVRKQGTLPYLGPDGKSMVTVRYEDNVPVGIEAIVISTQHRADVEPVSYTHLLLNILIEKSK